MLRRTGDARFDGLLDVLENTAPEVSVRLNPRKQMCLPTDGMDARKLSLPADAVEAGRVPWWPEAGVYLAERPRFTMDSALHQGRYYVQDASSMITAAVARWLGRLIGHPLLWLDACAAPGGKTTAALDGLPEGSFVLANEFDFKRAEILFENVVKWGSPYTAVSRGDTSRLSRLRGIFDVVAVDAPCSGEGMMRKDATAREQWSPHLVGECASLQMQIVENVWEALRPGGFLVYSTCTFNTEENEANVRRIIDRFGAEPVRPEFTDAEGHPLPSLPFDGAVTLPGETEPLPAMRFIPGRIRGEGLFMAILRKPGELHPAILDTPAAPKNKKGAKAAAGGAKSAIDPKLAAQATAWIDPAQAAAFEVCAADADGTLGIFPRAWKHLLPHLTRNLELLAAGTPVATVKGKSLIPCHPLAMSTAMNPDAFPRVELSEREALVYLMRETPELPAGTPAGFVTVTFGGYPLGFMKNIGNRANNLYPKEWRIKSKLAL